MLRLYDVLEQFVNDGGPKWAKIYYEEVKNNELESAAQQAITNNVRYYLSIFSSWHD